MNEVKNLFCPVCKLDTLKKYKVVESNLKKIPEGLDRSDHVKVEILKCYKCKLFKTDYLSKEIDLNKIYSEDSLSFDASLSKFKKDDHSAITFDELAMITLPANSKLLEIGCGAGHLLLRATKKGFSATGIDLDRKAIQFVKNKLKLNAHLSKIEDLPKNEKFDIIILIGVFEHIDEPNYFINLMKEHLNENGEIIMGLPNVRSLNRFVSEFGRHSWDMFLEPGHIYHYSKSNIKKMFHGSGLDLVFWKTASIKIRGKLPFLPFRSHYIERNVCRLTEKYYFFKILYILILKLIDLFKVGDILLLNFKIRK